MLLRAASLSMTSGFNYEAPTSCFLLALRISRSSYLMRLCVALKSRTTPSLTPSTSSETLTEEVLLPLSALFTQFSIKKTSRENFPSEAYAAITLHLPVASSYCPLLSSDLICSRLTTKYSEPAALSLLRRRSG